MKLLLSFSLLTGILTAQIQVLGIATSSDFTPDLPSPGSLASVFVRGLTGINGIVPATEYPLPYTLAGVSVTLCTPAPILAVADLGSYQQINIQVPVAPVPPAPCANLSIMVAQSGQVGAIATPPFAGWGVFFADASGRGVLQHTDYSLVTADNPAKPGEVLVAYATNLAPYNVISNAPPIGMPASSDPLPRVDESIFSFQVQVNGQPATSLYTGLTPDIIGVFQINFVVPASMGPGTAYLQILGIPSCFGFGSFCPDIESSHFVTFPVGLPD